MTRTSRGWFAAALVIAVAAAAAWWFVARTRPDAVGPRFVEALIDRHPATTVNGWDGGSLHTTLASGLYIDVHLAPVFAACEADRFACSDAITHALDDVGRVERGARDPTATMVAAIVLADVTPGFRFGFVTEPLVGSLECRYALVDGVASTFVTSAIADRLHMDRSALKIVALAALRAEQGVELERIDDDRAALYRVRAPGDPVASLLDPIRMKRFASTLGAARVYVAVPERGVLWLAADGQAQRTALAERVARERGSAFRAGEVGLLVYDTADAGRPALSLAGSTQ